MERTSQIFLIHDPFSAIYSTIHFACFDNINSCITVRWVCVNTEHFLLPEAPVICFLFLLPTLNRTAFVEVMKLNQIAISTEQSTHQAITSRIRKLLKRNKPNSFYLSVSCYCEYIESRRPYLRFAFLATTDFVFPPHITYSTVR